MLPFLPPFINHLSREARKSTIKSPFLQSLHSAVQTAKNPFQDLLFFLPKCNGKSHLNQILALFISTGLIHNPLAATKLVEFLSSHDTHLAHSVADQMDGPYAYTWNIVIRGWLDGDNPKEALLGYAHVRRKGLKIDSYTILHAIRACGLISGALSDGEQIHTHIPKMGFQSEVIIQTALVGLYGVFDKLVYAQKVFDETLHRDLVLWNALVGTYERRNHPHKALSVASTMMNANVRPNGVTVASILSACSSMMALDVGKMVHGFVTKCILGFDVFVYNALIDMYAKCSCLVNARRVFENMPTRNVVTWTSMINGYGNNSCPYEALSLFGEMKSSNVRFDEISLLSVVSMCAKLGLSELGEWIDQYVKKNGYGESTCVPNALMDMHAKCGNINKACQVFDGIMVKTLVSWSTMIQGLAMHGYGIAALLRFSQMQREGFRPDCIVFLSLLSACSHAGLVDEGRRCFRLMEEYGMPPWKEHYGCMVDLLCRAGLVDEALQFIESMPMEPDVVTWRTLLAACKSLGNIALARQILCHLLVLEPNYSGNYILMSNLHAIIGEWDNVKEVRDEMEVRGVIKSDPASSLVEEVNASLSIQ